MKNKNKIFIVLINILFFSANICFANPVSIHIAKNAGKKFMRNNTNICTENTELELVYIFSDKESTNNPFLYVFNVDKSGFVIVAADNLIGPIVGYSTENIFNTNNISPEFIYYIDRFIQKIKYHRENNIPASEKAIFQWNLVQTTGNITNTKGTNSVEPLCKTIWNQNALYNSLCPEDEEGPGNRVYAGCVACAMAQIMRFWNYPPSGNGSHSYTPFSYPTQSVNFSETTYNYNLMPLALTETSSSEEIFEVAQLMYHCGVSVDMNYSPRGSGASSSNVPNALSSYFQYDDNSYIIHKRSYKDDIWINLLKENLNKGYPIYYSGYNAKGEGHAFICDGYDATGNFHFNWGWGGNYNGYFALDSTFMFLHGQDAIINITPKYKDNPNVPTNFTLTSDDNYQYITLNWTNPSTNALGKKINGNLKIVIKKNDVIIDTLYSVTGESMTYTDTDLPNFGNYKYAIYAIKDTLQGFTTTKNIFFGTHCNIKITMLDSMRDGWGNASINIYSDNGILYNKITLLTGTIDSINVMLPPEITHFSWMPGNKSGYYDKECSFTIYDANDNKIYYRPFNNPLDSTRFLTINFDNDCNAIDINYYGINDFDNSVTIYPNPVTSYLTINSNEQIIKAELLDISGKLINTFCIDNTYANINISKYDNGIYLFRLYKQDSTVVIKKIIISK